jgi:phosphoribosyl 1,2-cyclic phosphate phosphodiesterase
MGQIGELIFLGTGTSQGVPVIGCSCSVCSSSNPKDNRTRSSVHLNIEGTSIQIDAGPDFRSQMLRENLQEVDAVLFTHEHQDHVGGLDDVRPIIFRTNSAMNIYGQSRVLDRIRAMYAYAFTDSPYPGVPKFEAHTIDESAPFHINGIKVIPIPILHGNLPILGYRIGGVAYLTDVNDIPSTSMELLKDLDTLIIDALHHRTHFSHYTLEEAIESARAIDAKQTYFVHMSHHMGLHDEVSANLPEGMKLSFDGMRIPIFD